MVEITTARSTVARDAISDTYPTTKVLAAATLLEAGKIDRDFFLAIVQDLLRAARVAMCAPVEALMALRYGLQPIGYLPPDFGFRDEASLITIIDSDRNVSARVQRFAQATLEQANRDFQIEIGKQHGATHWRWKADNESCIECTLKKNQVFPITEPMIDHPFCDCRPEIIFTKGKDND